MKMGVFLCCFLLFLCLSRSFVFFFFNDTATTEIYTLSLHDALPICDARVDLRCLDEAFDLEILALLHVRSEEHTSELQSQSNLVCRLLLEKKKKTVHQAITIY